VNTAIESKNNSASQSRRQPAGNRQDNRVGRKIAGDDPFAVRDRGRQTAGDIAQCHVGDRRVQHFHERGDDHRQRDDAGSNARRADGREISTAAAVMAAHPARWSEPSSAYRAAKSFRILSTRLFIDVNIGRHDKPTNSGILSDHNPSGRSAPADVVRPSRNSLSRSPPAKAPVSNPFPS